LKCNRGDLGQLAPRKKLLKSWRVILQGKPKALQAVLLGGLFVFVPERRLVKDRYDRKGEVVSPLEPTFEGDYSFAHDHPFQLDAGGGLQPINLHYAIYGRLNHQHDNAILVCHALSGSARIADWWPEMIGDGRAFDTRKYCVLGINVPGSCYGSTGPTTINPQTGRAYVADFPLISVSDIVRAQARLVIDHLGINKLYAVVGGSIGGMQALEWALRFPDHLEKCISIGSTPLAAMGLALNHLQRTAIQNDPQWQNGSYAGHEAPVAGLALARAIAMCSYKSAGLFNDRFERRPNRNGEKPGKSMTDRFDVAGYLDYQAETFTRRFDANSYLILSKAMDTFDLAQNGESDFETIRKIQAHLLLIGISSDWLFPAHDVQLLTERLQSNGADAKYAELRSSHGHDGFLADANLLAPLIRRFLSVSRNTRRLFRVAGVGACA